MDLGLPSGTLWLDRLVGAPSPSSIGLFYQWGAISGHTTTDGFSFIEDSYREQGLNAINTDLSESQDAARAFYGPSAKMPSQEQVEELIQYSSKESLANGTIRLTSLINGERIILYKGGFMSNQTQSLNGNLRVWLARYIDSVHAVSLHSTGSSLSISDKSSRYYGLNVMAVHS